MKKFLSEYLHLLQPWVCFVAYLWALEFQSVYEARYDPFLASLADCGAMLWGAVLAVAVLSVPIAILVHGALRNSILYLNQCAAKIWMGLVTYFYFRRWLERWSVTDITNSFMFWVLAGSIVLIVLWGVFRWTKGTGGHRFELPSLEDCFYFGAIPILCTSAIVLSVKVTSHLLAYEPSLLRASDVAASHNQTSQSRPNILLITVDALRAESTSLDGGQKTSTTPFLKTLATKSNVYSQMHSNAMSTSAAITAILSGKNPLAHGNLTRKVNRYDSEQNLLRILRENGYTTAAITSNGDAANVVAALSRFLSRPQFPESGSKLLSWLRRLGVYPTVAGAAMYRDLYIMYGFVRSFTVNLPHGYANDTFDLAARILSEISQPFFLFLHVHEPHVPYYVLSSRTAENSTRQEMEITHEVSPAFAGYYPPSRQLTVDGYRAHYEESIRFLDYQLERFLVGLERKGLSRNLLLLFVSDHGESFGRGYLGHGDELYEDSARVPLIVHFPNQTKGERVTGLVQSIDLAPTILNVVGLPTSSWMSGQALEPGRIPAPRDTIAVNYKQPTGGEYFRLPTLLSIWSGRYKLIISCKGDRIELYDLEKDAQESANLAAEKSEVVKSLKQKLNAELAKQTLEPKLSCEFDE
jgi:arylsulfatase A-like enzyme